MRVDLKRYAADLMLTSGAHTVEDNVPFVVIEPANEKSSFERSKAGIAGASG
jgi:hypothetical protein